jgi:stress response protein YsnF
VDLTGKLRKGLKIFGTDNREYGTIDRYDEQYAYVGKRQIPMSAFERMDNNRLYVGDQGRQYFETADRMDADSLGDDGDIRVQVREERLNVGKRQSEMGAAEIRKTVETEQVNIPVELQHEEVTVNRVDVRDRPVAAGELAGTFEEGPSASPCGARRPSFRRKRS